jgi:ABC-type antimicrobial peptide transport system permease subunit
VRRAGAASLVPELRAAITRVDPRLPAAQTGTLEDTISVGLLPGRVAAWLAGGFSVVGVLLAAVGVFGVTACNVSQRTREIGVRVALGATAREIMWLVMRQSTKLSAIGVGLGLLAAMAAAQLLRGLLYDVQPLDSLSFLGGAALFCAVAIAATWLPAKRALSVDPAHALKTE